MIPFDEVGLYGRYGYLQGSFDFDPATFRITHIRLTSERNGKFKGWRWIPVPELPEGGISRAEYEREPDLEVGPEHPLFPLLAPVLEQQYAQAMDDYVDDLRFRSRPASFDLEHVMVSIARVGASA